MVKIIIISTEGDLVNAVKTLNRIKKRLPRMTIEGMRRWGKILERDMKLSARKAGIDEFNNVLMTNGIRWDQGVRSKKGSLFIRLYGIYLDSMSPHFVNVTRRRTRLLAWAKQSRNFKRKAIMVESRQLDKFSIYVRPHPFIANGYRRARPKLRPVLKRMASRAIESS